VKGFGMRLFVHFDPNGTILSVSKVEFMASGLKHPPGALQEGEDVLELVPTAEQAALDVHELMARYSVDLKKRKLRKRRN
jgi:hypothetical protein